MAVNVADLQARLSLDIAQFQRSLQTAQKDLKGFQGVVDAYGREATETAMGQGKLTEAARKGGQQFQLTSKSIVDATRVSRVMAGALLSELNPALASIVQSSALAARATQGFGVTMTALSVGVVAVLASITAYVTAIKQAAQQQATLNLAIRQADIGTLSSQYDAAVQTLEEFRVRSQSVWGKILNIFEEGWRGVSGLFGAVPVPTVPEDVTRKFRELSEAQRQFMLPKVQAELALGTLEVSRGLAQLAGDRAVTEEQINRALQTEIGLLERIRAEEEKLAEIELQRAIQAAKTPEDLAAAFARRGAVRETGTARLQIGTTAAEAAARQRRLQQISPALFGETGLAGFGMGEFAGMPSPEEAASMGRQIQRELEQAGVILVDTLSRLTVAERKAHDLAQAILKLEHFEALEGPTGEFLGVPTEAEIAAFRRDVEAPMLAVKQSVREATIQFEILRTELTEGVEATDLARAAFELFRRRLEELTPVEREQAEKLAKIARESRELVRLHDDVAQVFSSVGQAIDRMVQGVIMGTQTMAEAFDNFFRNVLAQIASNVIRSLLRPVEEALAGMVTRLLTSQITVGGVTTTIGGALGGAAVAGGAAGVAGGQAVGGESGQMITKLGGAASALSGLRTMGAFNSGQGFLNVGLGAGAAGAAGLLGGALILLSSDPNVQRAGGALSSLSLLAGGATGAIGGALTAGLNLYSGISTLVSGQGNQGAAIGQVAGTVVGAIAGAIIGSVIPVIGTVVGGFIGAGIGGSAGGFLGGLFGSDKPQLSHAQREAAEAQRALAGAEGFRGQIAGAQNLNDLYQILLAQQTGYVGGTRSPAINVYLQGPAGVIPALPGVPLGAETGLNYLGLYGGHTGQEPVLSQQEFFSLVQAHPEALGVGIQQGVSPALLGGGNEAIRQTILAVITAIRAREAVIMEGLNELTKEVLQLRAGQAGDMIAILRGQVRDFKTLLTSLVADAQAALDRARVELLTMSDPEKIGPQVDKIRQLIVERYEGEIELIRAVVQEVQQLASAWAEVTAGISQQILGLQVGTFGTMQPTDVFALTQGKFRAAVTGFRAKPTPEAGVEVSAAANMLLEAASQLFTRPSFEYREIFAEVIRGLQDVEAEGLQQQAEFDSVLEELLGIGNTLESLIADNTAKMADDLEGLRSDLALIFGSLGMIPLAPGATPLTFPPSSGTPVPAAAAAEGISLPGVPEPHWLSVETFSFQHGGRVSRTGLALVHEGEEVIPAGGGGIVVRFGDVYVAGGADGAKAFMQEVERRIKTGRLGVVIADRLRRE